MVVCAITSYLLDFFCKGYFCYLFERQLYIIPPRKKDTWYSVTTALDTKKSSFGSQGWL